MKCNNRQANALWRKWVKSLLITVSIISSASVMAGNREQAKRMHDRLTGTIATNAMLDSMEAVMDNTPAGYVAAARVAIQNNPAFYNVTLKNFAAPWTNEPQTVFVPLNDYTATVIGLIRDSDNATKAGATLHDFHEVLYGDITYTGGGSVPTAASASNNTHYEELERTDLEANLIEVPQSSLNSLPTSATAGVMTSRAASEAFFIMGTNRAMFRFTLINHLCTDLEPLKDISRVPDMVRRDVSRSPGGDSRIFMNSCVGCHAGMDSLMPAFAYYDYNTGTGALDYKQDTSLIPNPDGADFANPNNVVSKFNHNETNFKYGYVARDDSWVNYWRDGQNGVLGWYNAITPDPNDGLIKGSGAKALGMELARSDAFDSCQVKKAFKAVCIRDSNDFTADRDEVSRIAGLFKADGNMINVFAEVAAYCKGP
jgi:hypothetical protein